ncbi:phage tail assembly chaperone [Ancylobacter mangrovi]|uniref:phage tail assembly chaperone n=1 Tax=Ancylobacter mangrovi TaxID=2972472 RepID=UPI002163C043|nr:hypothetical protein [Ancylobacter mangrovi]MCS0501623.1 hypothetical protein [Ancylobacter mangrovi]
MEWGDKIEWLQDLAEEGEAIPALSNQPTIPAHLEFAWSAFWALKNDRPLGFAMIGRISFTAIDRFARRYDVHGDAFERLRVLIAAMDAAFVEKVMARPK